MELGPVPLLSLVVSLAIKSPALYWSLCWCDSAVGGAPQPHVIMLRRGGPWSLASLSLSLDQLCPGLRL